MITDETYADEERQMRELFQQAGWDADPPPSTARIEAITERALHEIIIKDASSFIFRSFTSVTSNFLSAYFGSVSSDDHDYKP